AQGPCVQDRSAPSVALAPAPPAHVNSSTLTVSGFATDDLGVSTVTLRLNGAWISNLPVGANGAVSGSVTVPGEGAHTVSLEAVDGVGHRSVATAQVVYDATAPHVSLGTLPALTATRELQVTGSVADASGVASAELVLNGERHPLTPAADGSISATLALQEGSNSLSLVAVDAAGNARAAQASVVLDTRAPQVSVLSPVSGEVFGSSSLDLVVSVSDDSAVSGSVQGLVRTAPAGTSSLVFPVVIAAEGPATFDVHVQDAAGNAARVSVDVVLDLYAPLLSLEHVGGRPLQEAERFGPLPGHGLTLNARVEDLSATRVVFAHGASYSVAAGGGVLAEWVPLTEGHNVVEVSATDETGRQSVLRRNVVYDVTPPQGALSLPSAQAALRGSVELVAQGTDNLTGISAVSFQVDGGAWLAGTAGQAGSWSLELDTTLLSDGAHLVSALLRDGVGNVSSLSLPIAVDNTAPALALAALPNPARGIIALGAEASDATSGVSEVVLEVNGTQVHTCTGTALSRCETRFDTATLPNGPFMVSARALDAAGNAAAPAQQSGTAANAAPARFLVSPLPGASVKASMQVAVDVRESPLKQVECFVGGISLGSSSDPRFSASVDLSDRLDGALEVRCMAQDQAGNVGIETVTVQVRNWTLSLSPGTLNLRSKGGMVTLLVEGQNVELLLPTASRDLKLRVPGGAPVPVLEHRVSEQVGDANDNGVPDVTLKLERSALVRSLVAGLVAGAIDPRRPVTFELTSGAHVLGSYTVSVKH
ncbi:MAG TPA: Ig-like domain-containing protein, partial [Aggregicoccus sp.]|nr:Ig-like domain-containing protein [Aggregicoccus sp.]